MSAQVNLDSDSAAIQCCSDIDGIASVKLLGRWDIRAIRPRPRDIIQRLHSAGVAARWDLTQIKDIDAAGATLIWQAWNRTRPSNLMLRAEDAWVFDHLASLPRVGADASSARKGTRINLWRSSLETLRAGADGLALVGGVALDGAAMLLSAKDIPWREFTATIFRSGAQAVVISGIVGCLIGIVLSYLSGQELRDIGADSYVVNLVGFAVLRELGPLLAAILNAGRSGSAMTAQIGVMRVTGELEAMSVLGISHIRRLVVPKVIGQLVALPLIVAWTDAMAIVGGMVGARVQLGISYDSFLHGIVRLVPLSNVMFGVGKGALFGALIALISCHFGFRIQPDTESLSAGTTRAVVTALTAVLILDAVLAIAFSHVGM
jgi:phospholipid/cholesterol/gamma-HCH transport system permease protein